MSNDRQRMRELMPNVAAFVDEWRAVFPTLKVKYAEDLVTGHSATTRSTAPQQPRSAAQPRSSK